jgi:hypothetical protein
MNAQLFARIYGIVFLIVGIGGFIPGLTQPHEHPGLIVNGSSGMELGLYPVSYALLTVLGLIPATNTALGLVSIYGHYVWLHAVLAVVAAYFGLVRKEGKAAGCCGSRGKGKELSRSQCRDWAASRSACSAFRISSVIPLTCGSAASSRGDELPRRAAAS